MNGTDTAILQVLRDSRTIAIVGMSDKPERDSHIVANYLQAHGYRIIPINPACAGSKLLGEHCYASLTDAARALADQGLVIDVVDCFRKPETLGPILDEAIAIGAKTFWMQLGVVNHEVAERAKQAGLAVVMDRCIKLDHAAHAPLAP